MTKRGTLRSGGGRSLADVGVPISTIPTGGRPGDPKGAEPLWQHTPAITTASNPREKQAEGGRVEWRVGEAEWGRGGS